MNLRDAAQELVELGPRGTLFRIGWELKGLTGPASRVEPMSGGDSGLLASLGSLTPGAWTSRLQLEDPITLGRALRTRIPSISLQQLRRQADAALNGRIVCFGKWPVEAGNPIAWHRDPVTGGTWDPELPSLRALRGVGAGDVKHTWEVGRFPHAYHLARAATFFPERAELYATSLAGQIEQFVAENPAGRGVHWTSGQEVGIRLLAWVFALDALLLRTAIGKSAESRVAQALLAAARHIERHLDYARIAVYNNHLLSEALALLSAAALFQDGADATRWRNLGQRILDQEAQRQFYEDGGYIQQSHNYHRVALQTYVWACTFARSLGDSPSPAWLRALERSLDFLVAHQNPLDGRLPNYGSNDGALPSTLTTCDFTDMRPILQTVSVLTRGERLYEPGPWDEETAWFLGVKALDVPLRKSVRTSLSFGPTGYHVLRGHDQGSFCAFRCGTLKERFSQIDMLHTDVWWRGLNVLADPGSFQYNAAHGLHEHFMRTASHNTIVIDGRDQMHHRRQFKVLYWTKARLLAFTDTPDWARCDGEHYGYQRHAGRCVHRRSILFVKDDLWAVVDEVRGGDAGERHVRLHWLGGEFPWMQTGNGMALATPAGAFSVDVFDEEGRPQASSVAAGIENPPRGWLARYYGEKVPAPSLVVERRDLLPITFVTILSGAPYEASTDRRQWSIRQGQRRIEFGVGRAGIETLSVAGLSSR